MTTHERIDDQVHAMHAEIARRVNDQLEDDRKPGAMPEIVSPRGVAIALSGMGGNRHALLIREIAARMQAREIAAEVQKETK